MKRKELPHRRRAQGRVAKQRASVAIVLTGAGPLDHAASPAIPSKWAWHYRALSSWRDRLLKARADKLRVAAEPLETHGSNMADRATDEFDHNLALTGLSSAQDTLFEIEEALHRLRNGSYGKCEESGRPISQARLRAVPWTRFSKQAEERLEREGKLHGPRLGALGSVQAVLGELSEDTAAEASTGAPPLEERSARSVSSRRAPRRVAPPTTKKKRN